MFTGGKETTDLHTQSFQRTGKKVILLNLLYETSIVLIPKPIKDITRKENGKPVFSVNIKMSQINYHQTNPAIC